MSSFVDNLNLTPQEKRLVVGIAFVVFVVLNMVFVFPHRGDWARIQKQMTDLAETNKVYDAMIAQDTDITNGFHKQVLKLAKQGGGDGQFHDSSLKMQSTVANQARITGVSISSFDSGTPSRIGPTNAASQFFESESLRIPCTGTEESLVKFLYNIGNDPAMIRVKEINVQPMDANRYQLRAQITLTADYKKKVEAPPPTKPGATLPKPLMTTPPKQPGTVTPTNAKPSLSKIGGTNKLPPGVPQPPSGPPRVNKPPPKNP